VEPVDQADRADDPAGQVDREGQGRPIEADLKVDRLPCARVRRGDPVPVQQVEDQIVGQDGQRDEREGQEGQADPQERGTQADSDKDGDSRHPSQPGKPVEPFLQLPVQRQDVLGDHFFHGTGPGGFSFARRSLRRMFGSTGFWNTPANPSSWVSVAPWK
jgi:hypothetical protein